MKHLIAFALLLLATTIKAQDITVEGNVVGIDYKTKEITLMEDCNGHCEKEVHYTVLAVGPKNWAKWQDVILEGDYLVCTITKQLKMEVSPDLNAVPVCSLWKILSIMRPVIIYQADGPVPVNYLHR